MSEVPLYLTLSFFAFPTFLCAPRFEGLGFDVEDLGFWVQVSDLDSGLGLRVEG